MERDQTGSRREDFKDGFIMVFKPTISDNLQTLCSMIGIHEAKDGSKCQGKKRFTVAPKKTVKFSFEAKPKRFSMVFYLKIFPDLANLRIGAFDTNYVLKKSHETTGLQAYADGHFTMQLELSVPNDSESYDHRNLYFKFELDVLNDENRTEDDLPEYKHSRRRLDR